MWCHIYKLEQITQFYSLQRLYVYTNYWCTLWYFYLKIINIFLYLFSNTDTVFDKTIIYLPKLYCWCYSKLTNLFLMENIIWCKVLRGFIIGFNLCQDFYFYVMMKRPGPRNIQPTANQQLVNVMLKIP